MCGDHVGIFFGGAYYLGKYREAHTTSNFVASGIAAGLILPSVLIRPLKSRTMVFGGLAGAAMGATYSWLWQVGHSIRAGAFLDTCSTHAAKCEPLVSKSTLIQQDEVVSQLQMPVQGCIVHACISTFCNESLPM